MTEPPAQLGKVFLIAAATDVLTGLVLAAVGFSKEDSTLVVIGVALALAGTGVLSWLIVRTSRPEQL